MRLQLEMRSIEISTPGRKKHLLGAPFSSKIFIFVSEKYPVEIVFADPVVSLVGGQELLGADVWEVGAFELSQAAGAGLFVDADEAVP